MIVEGGRYVLGWPGMFDARYCTKTITSCRNHVTYSVFMTRVPHALGAGIKAEWGVLRHVVGPRGLEPCSGQLVVGPGGMKNDIGGRGGCSGAGEGGAGVGE